MNTHEECPNCLHAASALVQLRAILKTEGLFLAFARNKKLRAIKPLLYQAMDAIGADIHRDKNNGLGR